MPNELENEEIYNLIIENESFIYSIINNYKNYCDIDDLYQVGVIGMIKAYQNYDKNSSAKFTSYAYTYIFGEVIKYINENKSFKVSKEYRSLYKKINEAKTILTQKLMKEVSNYELSLFLEIDEKTIEEVMNINQTIDSLDREIISDGKKIFLEDTIGTYKDNIENIFLKDELEKLSKDELILLKKRYFLDETQSEIAKEMGVNQTKISREEQKILKKLSDSYQKSAKFV